MHWCAASRTKPVFAKKQSAERSKTVIIESRRDSRRDVTIAEVRASQDLSKTSLPYVMRYVFIPIAWVLTVAASRLGLSANAVTTARWVLYVVAAVMIAQTSQTFFVVGLALYLLSVLSDSVDGNLSRLNDSASYFGKFLDGFIDIVGDLVLSIAIAIHLEANEAPGENLVLFATIGVLCHAISFIIIHRLPLFKSMLAEHEGPAGVAAAGIAHPQLAAFLSRHLCGRFLMMFDTYGMNAIFDLRYVALAICIGTGQMTVFVLFIGALYMLAMLGFVAARIVRAYNELDLHRRSRSAT